MAPGELPDGVEAGDPGANCQTRAVYEVLTLERRDDGVAVITLRNGKVNALSTALLGELQGVGELAADLPGAVVITGGERIFAAGADINEFGGQAEARAITERFHATNDAVAALDRFVIAAVSGYALGGGCELALRATTGSPANGRLRAAGGPPRHRPGGGATQRLARLVGPSRAKELCITGRQVAAEEALRIGLADEVVAGDPHERRWPSPLRSPAAPSSPRRLCKRVIDDGLSAPLGDGLAAGTAAFVEAFGTEDCRSASPASASRTWQGQLHRSLSPAGARTVGPIVKNSGLGRMSKAWARRLERAKKPTMAAMSQMSSSLNPTARNGSASAGPTSSGVRRGERRSRGEPGGGRRAAPCASRRRRGRRSRILVADAQDRPVGDHAIGALVRRRGGDGDQLTVGLGQRRRLLVHEQVVELEERPEQRRSVGEGGEHVGHEPDFSATSAMRASMSAWYRCSRHPTLRHAPWSIWASPSRSPTPPRSENGPEGAQNAGSARPGGEAEARTATPAPVHRDHPGRDAVGAGRREHESPIRAVRRPAPA